MRTGPFGRGDYVGCRWGPPLEAYDGAEDPCGCERVAGVWGRRLGRGGRHPCMTGTAHVVGKVALRPSRSDGNRVGRSRPCEPGIPCRWGGGSRVRHCAALCTGGRPACDDYAVPGDGSHRNLGLEGATGSDAACAGCQGAHQQAAGDSTS